MFGMYLLSLSQQPFYSQTTRPFVRQTDCWGSKDSQLELNRPLLCLSLLVSGSLVDTHQRRDRSRASLSNLKDCPKINNRRLEPSHLTCPALCAIYTGRHNMMNHKALKKKLIIFPFFLPFIANGKGKC